MVEEKKSVVSKPAPAKSAQGHKICKRILLATFAAALAVSFVSVHLSTEVQLRRNCVTVTDGFSSIMNSYKHSFRLFEELLLQKIGSGADSDSIEEFLKALDSRLYNIEGGDYDGVYMYYGGRYLYSWDTPRSAYDDTGYDATKRPWYIGAVEAAGEIYFSTPYPSYANDYMLATISRLQEDGETVIAYDIKLGEIGKYVERLDITDGALALICDGEGNIIGSTNHLYLGGNYNRTEAWLNAKIAEARTEFDTADGEVGLDKAELKLRSAEAQKELVLREKTFIIDIAEHMGRLQYSLRSFSLGYAYEAGGYTCFVRAPLTEMLCRSVIVWAAISFAALVVAFLFMKMIQRSSQVQTDELTGISNRRAFTAYCGSRLRHHPGEKVALLLIDLNHFKRINDMYGHIVGDRALVGAAELLRRSCEAAPRNYFLCRYGGDEFLIAVPSYLEGEPEQLRDHITESFRKSGGVGDAPYTLDASIGIACGVFRDKKTIDELVISADSAMYEEKKKLAR